MARVVLGAGAFLLALGFHADHAQAEYLAEQATLRAEPQGNAPIVAVLPAGAEARVEPGPRGWSFLVVGQFSGYAQTKRLKLTLAPEGEAAVVATSCDLGYPYSGSAVYFTGLTELRTSEPFSFLFGRHVARPC
jgi:hypothetical protein